MLLPKSDHLHRLYVGRGERERGCYLGLTTGPGSDSNCKPDGALEAMLKFCSRTQTIVTLGYYSSGYVVSQKRSNQTRIRARDVPAPRWRRRRRWREGRQPLLMPVKDFEMPFKSILKNVSKALHGVLSCMTHSSHCARHISGSHGWSQRP